MFRVGLTRDFLTPSGELVYKDIGLSLLEEAGIQYAFLPDHKPTITPDLLQGFDAVISLAPAYDSHSFEGLNGLKAICRFGVGYDMVDVTACTDAGIMLTITRGAVNYSVAEATITWMLALSHRAFEKDRLVREGKWHQRSHFMGGELRNKTLGIIGLGGIGGQLVGLLRNFRMNQPLTFDPHISVSDAESLGVKSVSLGELMAASDFISVSCPLTAETRNLIDKHAFSQIKKAPYLINTARGGIINKEALVDALDKGLLAGYATDVFDTEPPSTDDPLFKYNNVILAPHAIAWTDELFSEIGYMACRQIIQIASGQRPDHLINPEVLQLK